MTDRFISYVLCKIENDVKSSTFLFVKKHNTPESEVNLKTYTHIRYDIKQDLHFTTNPTQEKRL